MRKIFSLLSLCFITLHGFAQSCCTSGDFGLLALNADFKAAHEDPLPMDYQPTTGRMIDFETQDAGKKGRAFYVPSDQPTDKVLVIFHEWWGLNDYIKQEAERWQKQLGNVDVYAVDLYDGTVAATADVASKLSSNLDNNKKRGETIIKGVLSTIGMNKQVATMGWCMGGSWAFTATLLAGNQATGCIMYYGFPEKDEKKVKTVKTDVLYMRATKDKFIPVEAVTKFGQQVQAAGHTFDLHEYDAVHAFANPSNPNHDKLATAQAEDLSLKFLKAKLQLD